MRTWTIFVGWAMASLLLLGLSWLSVPLYFGNRSPNDAFSFALELPFWTYTFPFFRGLPWLNAAATGATLPLAASPSPLVSREWGDEPRTILLTGVVCCAIGTALYGGITTALLRLRKYRRQLLLVLALGLLFGFTLTILHWLTEVWPLSWGWEAGRRLERAIGVLTWPQAAAMGLVGSKLPDGLLVTHGPGRVFVERSSLLVWLTVAECLLAWIVCWGTWRAIRRFRRWLAAKTSPSGNT